MSILYKLRSAIAPKPKLRSPQELPEPRGASVILWCKNSKQGLHWRRARYVGKGMELASAKAHHTQYDEIIDGQRYKVEGWYQFGPKNLAHIHGLHLINAEMLGWMYCPTPDFKEPTK